MATNGLKRCQTTTAAPPRTLNVQKFAEARAPEFESLQKLISARLNDDFRSRRNKRRRTTSFVNKKRRFCKRRKVECNKNDNEDDESRKVSRKVKRRIELKMNNVSGFSCSGDGSKRLRTHVWHAKRFSMSKRWGFCLPLGLHGRGRGSRALLKHFRERAVVHDASYHSAIQLEGSEESILSVLNVVLMPSPSAYSEERFSSILNGTKYGRSVLHHVEGPASRPVAPVTYMWRPICQQIGITANVDNIDACKELQNPNLSRQLWVWIHASAFTEGYDALKSVCQKEMTDRGILVNCLSLEGELAKLELMGPKAFQLLQSILEPARCDLNMTWSLRKHSAGVAGDDYNLRGSSILQNEESIAYGTVINLNVQDPRTLPKRDSGDSNLLSTGDGNDIPECEARVSPSSEERKQDLTVIDSQLEDMRDNLINRDIWDISTGISPPVEESIICREKYKERMKFICLDDTYMEGPSTSTNIQSSVYCPIMLLKDIYGKDSVAGWYIILPICWVRVFWVSLVTKGAHAMGLREKQWIASEVGLPNFPSDFPDCNAYHCLKACEAAESDEKAELRPPSIRPAKFPVPPPWDSILVTFDKGPIRVQIPAGKDTLTKSVPNPNIVECDTKLFGNNPSTAVVARSSAMLRDYLDKIHGGHLPLFPQVPNEVKDLINLQREKNNIGCDQNGTTPINYGNPLCFLRVHLCAHKEGVFEEGAIVCAPHSSDLSLLTSRSGCEEGGLQIPQSSVGSYFVEQSSGRWELKIPEDPISLKCHRWPIGFITTGFVRGSKRPLAQAYCEAVLLAHLREEQWNGKPAKRRKKDIYVLVRNIRSSAYRLAHATIVLEQQDEDLEYM